jgi:DNA-3-methyladenine glycosylase II
MGAPKSTSTNDNNVNKVPKHLTARSFSIALKTLQSSDSDLGRVLQDYGPPPMWAREPGFESLTQIILEQQVSLASARAVFVKLKAICSPLTPTRFIEIDDLTLREAGFSRQKTRYVRNLARSILEGSIDLDRLEKIPDLDARSELIKLTGIGPWTADIYLLMALRRPDIWPTADLALAVAVQKLKALDERPKEESLQQISEAWKPWRSVAARILWHYYLSS